MIKKRYSGWKFRGVGEWGPGVRFNHVIKGIPMELSASAAKLP